MNIEPRSSARTRAMALSNELHGWFVGAGAALVALGLLAIALPFAFTIAADFAVGALLVIGGAVHGAHALRGPRGAGMAWRLVVAALYLVAGVLAIAHPVTGALALTIVLAAFLAATGVTRIGLGLHLRPIAGWGWTVFNGALSLVLGFLLLAGWPSTAAWAVGLFIGVDLLFAGWSLLAIAAAARHPAR
jgi:uncharacterized membrane protein HdeD (DUF308 family)